VNQNMKKQRLCSRFTLKDTWDLAARELSDSVEGS
jgi:hypothetical protein